MDKIGIDQYISESFSVGMTMLEAALLSLSDTLYNSREKTFDKKELNNRVVRVLQNANQTRYSKALRTTIAGLCEVVPEDRLQATLIYDKLKVHDS